ncbi:MAG: MATE family efflux transporter [bacterium]|nr:MATE family efflux transporter [bacterium]
MKDLTTGAPGKVILRFALPIFLGQIFQLCYSLTDTWIIGKVLGDQALAAVGSVTPLSDMIIGFLIGLTNGFGVITAYWFGAKENEQVNRSFGGSLLFGTLTALVFTICSVLFLPQFLRLVHVPAEHTAAATAYIKVILLGMFTAMLYNVFSATLRAIGDTIAPLIFLVVSALLNIVMDFLFVAGLHMGISGASIATVIAQLISALLCAAYIIKKYPALRLSGDSFRLNAKMSRELWMSGLSMGLMNSLVMMGTLILQGAINLFNSNIIVAHYAARKITHFFMIPFAVLSMTSASYCGQNYGAKLYDRIREGIKKCILFAWIWTIGVILLTYLCAPVMIRLITSTTKAEIIDTAVLYLRVNTLLYFVPAVITVSRNALQGIGDHITPIISSAIELLGKLFTVLFLAPALQYFGIIISEPIVWVLMVIPLIIKLKKSDVYTAKSK